MHCARRSRLNCIFSSASGSANFPISVALNLSAKITTPNEMELIAVAGGTSFICFDSNIKHFKMAR